MKIIPFDSFTASFWVAWEVGFVLLHDCDPLFSDVLRWDNRLCINTTVTVENVHYSITGVQAWEVEHIADVLPSLKTSQKGRGHNEPYVLWNNN